MTDFEKMVIDILIGIEVTEVVRFFAWMWFKLKPLITSRKRRRREVADDE